MSASLRSSSTSVLRDLAQLLGLRLLDELRLTLANGGIFCACPPCWACSCCCLASS